MDFAQAGVRAGGPPGALARNSLAADGFGRNLLPRRPRRSDPGICARTMRRTRRSPSGMVFNERFECKKCGARLSGAGAAPVFLQQSLRRVPALPGLRQHHRFRSRPRDSGQKQIARRRRDRAVDQAALPPAVRMDMRDSRAPKAFPLDVPFRDLTAAQRDAIIEGDPKTDYPGVKGFFGWLERKKYKLHVRVFLSRYRGYATLPRLPRHAPARRSSRRENRRAIDHRSLPDDGERGAALLRQPAAERRAKPPSPTKFWKKFSSGCAFSTKSASTTSRSTGSPRRFPAARRSAFNWPLRSARIWWARSTCSTSLRSACTRATRTA